MMKFKNQQQKEIVEQREREIRQLAIETAYRLNGVKPTDSIPCYKEKNIKQTVKKKINYGFLNLFTKEVEEIVERREFVPEYHFVNGWILDSSISEEWFELRIDPNGPHGSWAHLEEYVFYYILKKDGSLDKIWGKNNRSGRIYDSSFPHRNDCVEVRSETVFSSSLNNMFSDSDKFKSISDIALLDIPRHSWLFERDDGMICIRNYPTYLDRERYSQDIEKQFGQDISEDYIVDNYGLSMIQKLRSL